MANVRRVTKVGQVGEKYEGSDNYKWRKTVEVTFTIDMDDPTAVADWDNKALRQGMVDAATRLRNMYPNVPDAYEYKVGEQLPRGFGMTPEAAAEKCSDEQLLAILRKRGLA